MKSNRFATMMCFDQRRSTRNRIESKKFSRAHNPNIIRWISRKSEFWLWHLIAVLNHRTRNLCALLVTKFRQRASLSIRIDLRCASLFSGACVCVVLRKCKTERAFSHLGTCRCQLFCFVVLLFSLEIYFGVRVLFIFNEFYTCVYMLLVVVATATRCWCCQDNFCVLFLLRLVASSFFFRCYAFCFRSDVCDLYFVFTIYSFFPQCILGIFAPDLRRLSFYGFNRFLCFSLK